MTALRWRLLSVPRIVGAYGWGSLKVQRRAPLGLAALLLLIVATGADAGASGRPQRLGYSTLIGRGVDGGAADVAVDRHGFVYLTGTTRSTRFPTTRGSFQARYPGRIEGDSGRRSPVAFVTKLSPDGRHIVYSTYFGARGGAQANAIAVDRQGNAYIAGLAYGVGVPTTRGAFRAKPPSPESVFVAKLDRRGRRLRYSTYVGDGQAKGIAIDRAGAAYVAGYTYSSRFPTTRGAAQPRGFNQLREAAIDGFVTKLSPSGHRLAYSTYLASSDDDEATAIDVDRAGRAYVTGSSENGESEPDETSAPRVELPTTRGAFQRRTRSPDLGNAFVAKLSRTGRGFAYLTYLGGDGLEFGTAIAADRAGRAHVAGIASSSRFPTKRGAFQHRLRSAFGSFLTTLSPNGHRLAGSTLLGGKDTDYGGEFTEARGIALTRSGAAYVVGNTSSRHLPITRGAIQRHNRTRTQNNAFVAKLNRAGSELLYSTYLGGRAARATSVALGRAGAAYVVGGAGRGFPVTQSERGRVRRPPFPRYPDPFVVRLKG